MSSRRQQRVIGRCSHGCIPSPNEVEKAEVCRGSIICGCQM